MRQILDMTVWELEAEMAALGQPAYRGRQVASWVWVRRAASFEEMTDLPAELRQRLPQQYAILTAEVVGRSDSSDGTVKLLLRLSDGEHVETVAIPAEKRLTACLSTQVGCAMGCAFCATGQGGFVRNLSAGEVVEQLLHLERACLRRVTHAVFMGMGEPLANYDATLAAVRALIDPRRLGISARRVTISTVGLPKAIRRLAAEDLPITLAVSLHAPNDALRRELVPPAARYPVAEVIAAAQDYFRSRKREVTLEYVLLAGANDTPICAEALARIAGQLRCSVNLIRYNPIPSLAFGRPTEASVKAFAERLARRGVNVQVRRSRGLDVSAACGQLRRQVAESSTR